MKNRIAVAVASLLMASLGTAAYAQGAQQTPPPPPPAPATTSATMPGNGQMGQTGQMGQMGQNHDTMVEHKIKRALTKHGVTATNVQVSFSDGTATLSGTVYNKPDIAKAKKAAMHVRGVKNVDTSNLHARTQQVSQSSD